MSAEPALSSASDDAANRRIAERHDLTGTQMKLLMDGMHFTLHLKDLSTTGLCGLTDAPIAQGQKICLLIDKWQPVAAEVKWVRKALIGAAFTEPLMPDQVVRLKRSHGSKRGR